MSRDAANTVDQASEPSELDHRALQPVARRALRRRTAVLTGWRWQPLSYTVILSGRTVLRVDGTAEVGGRVVPWSAVLKIVEPPAPAERLAQDPFGWQREVLAYRSGLLRRLPGDLAAPRLLGAWRQSNGAWWLWLEDVADVHAGQWPLERYGLAAQHLGQFNGAFLVSQGVPVLPWLKQHWAEWYAELARIPAAAREVARRVPQPAVRRLFGPDVAESAARLLADQSLVLTALSELPQTLCHHDAARANLIARRDRAGRPQTVAVDWEDVGPGPLYADLATLVFGTMRRNEWPAHEAVALEEQAFDGYLRGLRDAGWDGDATVVWMGYTAAVALRWSLLLNALRLATDEGARATSARIWRQPAATLLDQWVPLSAFLLDRSGEARRCLQQRTHG